MDSNATTATTCDKPLNSYWNFLFVPCYIFFVSFTVQAKYKQMPTMIAIALVGYIVNFYANMKFSASAPIAYTFGAFAIGILANLYSRLRHGVAAAVLLPAVYVQVPGSLASSGAINSALTTASSLIKGTGNNSTEIVSKLASTITEHLASQSHFATTASLPQIAMSPHWLRHELEAILHWQGSSAADAIVRCVRFDIALQHHLLALTRSHIDL
jgi:uncharacterized membrane protein YjjB (DUF3815 family)